jgi:hypothetical protein
MLWLRTHLWAVGRTIGGSVVDGSMGDVKGIGNIMKQCVHRRREIADHRVYPLAIGLLLLIAGLCAPASATAQTEIDIEGLMNEALDQHVDISVQDKPLSEAFMIVAEQTGVAMVIAPSTVNLIPYGANTILTAEMKDIPLRVGMDRLLLPIGMRHRVVGMNLEIYPSDALRRIGRRATWDELKTIYWLDSTKYSGEAAALEAIEKRIRVDGLPRSKVVEPLLKAMRESQSGTLAEVLSGACRSMGLAWRAEGAGIVVLPGDEQIRRDLDRPVTLRAKHRPLAEVLDELGRQSGVRLAVDAEAMGRLDSTVRDDFSMLLRNSPLVVALDAVTSATGLRYELAADGVRFVAPEGDRSVTPAVIIVLPGRGELRLFTEDLPDGFMETLVGLFDQLAESGRREGS